MQLHIFHKAKNLDNSLQNIAAINVFELKNPTYWCTELYHASLQQRYLTYVTEFQYDSLFIIKILPEFRINYGNRHFE